VITGNKDFVCKRQFAKPIEEIKYFGKFAPVRDITCMNQEITFR